MNKKIFHHFSPFSINEKLSSGRYFLRNTAVIQEIFFHYAKVNNPLRARV